MFSPGGNGQLYRLTPIDSGCEIISDEYTFQNVYVAPTMARFENKLGGRIVVMAMALNHNNSQALFNYRRQKLFAELLEWCGSRSIHVRDAALVFAIENRPIKEADYMALLTLINLSSDSLDFAKLHLPEELRSCKILALDISGEWSLIETDPTSDGMIVKTRIDYLKPVYLLFKQGGKS